MTRHRSRSSSATIMHSSFSVAVRRALGRPRPILSLGAGILIAGGAIADEVAFPPVFELSSLDGTNGFVLQGVHVDDFSGASVSDAGDVNGDGIDDLLIGADEADSPAQNSGRAYVVFGRTTGFPPAFPLSSLDSAEGGDGSEGFVLEGADVNEEVGGAVSAAGDVNGDGIADLLVAATGAAPGGRSDAGVTYVVFGRSTGFPANFALSGLKPANGGDGSEGTVLRGVDFFDAQAGMSLAKAGDVDGDGIDDILIGATGANASYVVFGRSNGFPATFDLSLLDSANGGHGQTGFVIHGIEDSDRLGDSVSGAGDVNGDGLDDFLVGASHASPHNLAREGVTYLIFGRSSGFPANLNLHALYPPFGGDGSKGVVINGFDSFDESGFAVSRAGDINGDGIDDVLIGAPYASPHNPYAGQSYVVYGRTTGFSAVLELRTLHQLPGGDAGFILNSAHERENAGYSVSNARDVNGDGIDDFLIGAPKAMPGNRSTAGENYVVYGRTTGFRPVFELRNLEPDNGGDGSEGFIIAGIDATDESAHALSDLGDVNGDGIGDILIGAHNADPNGQSRAGETYVVFGRAAALR